MYTLALILVLIGGWLLASVIGTWAYFADRPQANWTPFAKFEADLYKTLRARRKAKSS